MKELTEDDAHQIVSNFLPNVDRGSFRLVGAICRQQRVVIVQMSVDEFIGYRAGVTTLKLERQ